MAQKLFVGDQDDDSQTDPPPVAAPMPPKPIQPQEGPLPAAAETSRPRSPLRASGAHPGFASDRTTMVEVFDGTARAIDGKPPEQCPRFHTIIVDNIHITHKFLPNQWTEMPIDHGMKFIRHENFMVRLKGETQLMPRPLDIQDLLKPVDPAVLPPHQCVAEYAELNADALLIRCKMLPGGESIGNRNGRETMIRFLTDARTRAQAMRLRERGDAVDADDPTFVPMDDDQMQKLLPADDI